MSDLNTPLTTRSGRVRLTEEKVKKNQEEKERNVKKN